MADRAHQKHRLRAVTRLAGAATLGGSIALAGCGDGGHRAGATGAADAAFAPKAEPAAVPVHRFAKRSSGAYFYTASESEKAAILEAYPDFRYEGVGFDSGGAQPVYRFANLNNGGYFYTASEGERDSVLLNHRHLRFEGISFRVALANDGRRRPVFRLAHLRNGAYLYTLDAAERAAALALGHWRDEGVAWWADVPGAGGSPPPGQPGAQDPPGDPPAVPPPGPPSVDGPQGLYIGESPDGWDLRIAVLPSGEAWTLYGLPGSAGMQLQGFVQVQGAAEAGVWSGRGRDYTVDRGLRGNLEATFGEGRFDGAVSTTRAGFPFTSALPAAGDVASELAAVAGTWQGTMLDGAAATVEIAADGTLSGSSGGCSFSGAVAPSASAVPVFAVTIAFGEQPCRIPLRSFDGIAIVEALEGGSHQLLMPIVGLHGALGNAFSATR